MHLLALLIQIQILTSRSAYSENSLYFSFWIASHVSFYGITDEPPLLYMI